MKMTKKILRKSGSGIKFTNFPQFNYFKDLVILPLMFTTTMKKPDIKFYPFMKARCVKKQF